MYILWALVSVLFAKQLIGVQTEVSFCQFCFSFFFPSIHFPADTAFPFDFYG